MSGRVRPEWAIVLLILIGVLFALYQSWLLGGWRLLVGSSLGAVTVVGFLSWLERRSGG